MQNNTTTKHLTNNIMKIENGKWVDQYGDPVTVFNFNE